MTTKPRTKSRRAITSAAAAESKLVQAVAEKSKSAPALAATMAGETDLFGQGTVTIVAVLRANEVWSAGLEQIGQTVLNLTQASMESAAMTGVALLDTSSLPSAMGVGMEYAKGQLDRLIRGTAELSELGWKVATAAYAPIVERTRQAADAAGKPQTR